MTNKIFKASLIITIPLSLFLIYSGYNTYFCLTMLVWVNLFIFSVCDFSRRSVLFGWLITFFIFLLGRDFLEIYFDYHTEGFSDEVNDHAYLVYLLSLVTLAVCYIIIPVRQNKNINEHKKDAFTDEIELVSRKLFLFTICGSIVYKLIIIKYVSNYSYFEYYTDFSANIENNAVTNILNIIDRMMPVALCCFLACMPSKQRLKLPLSAYAVYLVISLGTKARSTTMLGLLFLFIYIMIRQSVYQDEKWLKKKHIVMIICLVPVISIAGTYINSSRIGGKTETSLMEAFISFFYDQGVTSNVIKRGYMYSFRLPDNVLFTLEFLRSGILARVLGLKVYYGNSLERALYGGSYAHSIAYIVFGRKYIAGMGTGTSYLAEFYQDFGYKGIVIGTTIYSFLIKKISYIYYEKTSIWLKMLWLYLIQKILWAPRGSFADIIVAFFSVPFIVPLLLIFIISKIRLNSKKTQMVS